MMSGIGMYEGEMRQIEPAAIGNIYGFEPCKSAEIVATYTRRLLDGAQFPPVEVVPYKEGFRLAFKRLPNSTKIDGGHYRSLAAMLAWRPLAVIITEDDALERVEESLFPLCKTRFVTAKEDTIGFFRQDREERLGTLDKRL